MANTSIKYLKDENGDIISPVVNIKGIYDDTGKSLLDLFYPIGSYYETSDDSFDPNVSWGGTWVQDSKGLVIVGAYEEGMNRPDNDRLYIIQGEILGEANHTLTIDEIPSHTHSNGNIYATTPAAGGTSGVAVSGGTGSVNFWYGNDGNTGGSQSHNNTQPSLGAYRWHRIS